ncbi:MAG: hypothetical protein ACJ8CB_04325 [Ktedonobacteraceae bacterium]
MSVWSTHIVTGQGQAIAPAMDALRGPMRKHGRTGRGQAIAPTMDGLRLPGRQHSRGDGLSSPSFAGQSIALLLQFVLSRQCLEGVDDPTR